VARLLELARLLVSRLLVALLGVSRLLVALLGVSRLLEVLLGVSRLLEVLLRVSRLLVALWLSLLWGVAGVLSRLLIALVVSGRLVALLGVRLLVALESLTCGWRRRLGRRNGLLLADVRPRRLRLRQIGVCRRFGRFSGVGTVGGGAERLGHDCSSWCGRASRLRGERADRPPGAP
jgi:hypothetical protein